MLLMFFILTFNMSDFFDSAALTWDTKHQRVAQAKAIAENTPVRTLRVNVEFWTAVVLEHVGIPRTLYSSTFCASRMIGWGEHIREQTSNNKLYRPLSYYTGKKPV